MIHLIIFLILNGIDLLTTKLVLKRGGYELNPIARKFGSFKVKLFCCISMTILNFINPYFYIILFIFNLIYLFVCILNLFTLFEVKDNPTS